VVPVGPIRLLGQHRSDGEHSCIVRQIIECIVWQIIESIARDGVRKFEDCRKMSAQRVEIRRVDGSAPATTRPKNRVAQRMDDVRRDPPDR